MMWLHCLLRLDQFLSLWNSWLTRCVLMWPWNVGASLSSVIACGLGAADAVAWMCKMAAELSWSWSAVSAGCCVVILWYLSGMCSEETKSDLGRLSYVRPYKSCLNGRLSEVSFEKSCLNARVAMIGLVGCAESTAVIGWISCCLLWLAVRMWTPSSAVCFGSKDAEPILLGEEQILPLLLA